MPQTFAFASPVCGQITGKSAGILGNVVIEPIAPDAATNGNTEAAKAAAVELPPDSDEEGADPADNGKARLSPHELSFSHFYWRSRRFVRIDTQACETPCRRECDVTMDSIHNMDSIHDMRVTLIW